MSDDADEQRIEPPVVIESFGDPGREVSVGDPAGRRERSRRGTCEPPEGSVRGLRRVGRGCSALDDAATDGEDGH